MTKLQLAGAAMCVLMAASLGACNKAEPAKPAVDTAKISDAIKADVAQRIAAVNAHDADKYASHYATDAIAMRSGRPNSVGVAAIEASFKQTLAETPDLKVTLSDQVVDVASSGDLAVFRSTSVATTTDAKTHKTGSPPREIPWRGTNRRPTARGRSSGASSQTLAQPIQRSPPPKAERDRLAAAGAGVGCRSNFALGRRPQSGSWETRLGGGSESCRSAPFKRLPRRWPHPY
jgi:uncharacterized protein (TIGR02246 family)